MKVRFKTVLFSSVLVAHYYGKRKNKRIGRPPGGHSNLEVAMKKPNKRRKRRKHFFVHKKKRSSASVDNTPAGSPQVWDFLQLWYCMWSLTSFSWNIKLLVPCSLKLQLTNQWQLQLFSWTSYFLKKISSVFFLPLQGSGGEEDDDQDEVDEESLTEDSTSEHQDELLEESEVSEKKSLSSSPTQSELSHSLAQDRDKRKRKLRTFSFSDDENKPPSPKVTSNVDLCACLLAVRQAQISWEYKMSYVYSHKILCYAIKGIVKTLQSNQKSLFLLQSYYRTVIKTKQKAVGRMVNISQLWALLFIQPEQWCGVDQILGLDSCLLGDLL